MIDELKTKTRLISNRRNFLIVKIVKNSANYALQKIAFFPSLFYSRNGTLTVQQFTMICNLSMNLLIYANISK